MGWLDSLFGGGSSSSSSTTSTQIDPNLKALLDKLLPKATSALDMPYPQYTGQRTAGPTQYASRMDQAAGAAQARIGAGPTASENKLASFLSNPGVSRGGAPNFAAPTQTPSPVPQPPARSSPATGPIPMAGGPQIPVPVPARQVVQPTYRAPQLPPAMPQWPGAAGGGAPQLPQVQAPGSMGGQIAPNVGQLQPPPYPR